MTGDRSAPRDDSEALPPHEGSSPGANGKRARPKRRAADHDALVSDSFLRPSFTLEQIRTFLAVASREHVTHAAQVLRLSQPAVTQQVQLLERALGVRLLERVGRNIRLTSAGIEVAGACLLIMRSLENLESVVQAVRGLDLGTVTVGGSHLAANYYLPLVITDFAAAHPRINVGVVVGDAEEICEQVAAGHLECALIDGALSAPAPNLVRTRVADTDVVIVGHPQHAADVRQQPAREVLRNSRYLVWSPGSPIELAAAKILGEHYECAQRLEIGGLEAARRSLLSAPGFVAAMPTVAVYEDLRSGALATLSDHTAPLPLYAVRRQGSDSPAVDVLWQALITKSAV